MGSISIYDINKEVLAHVRGVLRSLTLFDSLTNDSADGCDESDSESHNYQLAPVNDEVRKGPRKITWLKEYITRRITLNKCTEDGFEDERQEMLMVILAEVNDIWYSLLHIPCNPFLSDEENIELRRRMAVHVVTVCEKLYEHYLQKWQVLNKRGIFNKSVNFTRLKAQLASSVNKFLNLTTMKRYISEDIKNKSSSAQIDVFDSVNEAEQCSTLPTLTHAEMFRLSRPMEPIPVKEKIFDSEVLLDNMKRELSKMMIENDELSDFRASLSSQLHLLFPASDMKSATETDDRRQSFHVQPLVKKSEEQRSREKVILKRSRSVCDISNNTLSDALECTELLRNIRNAVKEEIKHEQKVGEKHINMAPDVSPYARTEADLKKLTSVVKPEANNPENLDPLLQVIILSQKHDGRMKKLEHILEELTTKDGDREEREKLILQSALHIQPDTTTKHFITNKNTVRISNSRISNRVCMLSVILEPCSILYNDLTNEITAECVKSLDNNLSLNEEISEVFDEIFKNRSSDHLNIDGDLFEGEHIELGSFDECGLDWIPVNHDLCNNVRPLLGDFSVKRYNEQRKTPQQDETEVICSSDYQKYAASKHRDYLNAMFDSKWFERNERIEAEVKSARTTSRSVHTERSERGHSMLHELRSRKSDYNEDTWNTGAVLIGGLGKDPFVPELFAEMYLGDLIQPERTGSSIISKRTRNTLRGIEAASADELQSLHNSVVAEQTSQLQDHLEMIWDLLKMPDDMRLDMAVKYSSDKYYSALSSAVVEWGLAADLIVRREKLIGELETFEMESCADRTRLLHRDCNGNRLLIECRIRESINKKIAFVDKSLVPVLERIEKLFRDVVTYQGRRYLDKMKSDRTEMLYWIQELRKIDTVQSTLNNFSIPVTDISQD